MDRTTVGRDLLAYVAAKGVELTGDLEQVERVLREHVFEVAAAGLELCSRNVGRDTKVRAGRVDAVGGNGL